MQQNSISKEQLEQLSQAELVALVLELYAAVVSLQARVAALEAAAGAGLPPANSRNSGQPPSRDQKANPPEKQTMKRVGAQFGHEAAQRPLGENH